MNEGDADSFTNCFKEDPDLMRKVENMIDKTDAGDNYVCKVNTNV